MNVIALRGVSCSRRRLRRNAQVRSNVKMVIWGSETSAPSGWEKFRYEATKESTKHTKKTNKTPRNINPKLKITPLPIFFGGVGTCPKNDWYDNCGSQSFTFTTCISSSVGAMCKKHSAWPDNGAWNCVTWCGKWRKVDPKKGTFSQEMSLVLTIEFSGNMWVPRKSRVETGFAINVSPPKNPRTCHSWKHTPFPNLLWKFSYTPQFVTPQWWTLAN